MTPSGRSSTYPSFIHALNPLPLPARIPTQPQSLSIAPQQRLVLELPLPTRPSWQAKLAPNHHPHPFHHDQCHKHNHNQDHNTTTQSSAVARQHRSKSQARHGIAAQHIPSATFEVYVGVDSKMALFSSNISHFYLLRLPSGA